ncbi:MAG: carboxypeptidase regulatory-like domain-containing protein, partial [Crocinitomicaceae bacterium]|nr:carboxypeptidase regulatory-like domain-containing protein [Crocinitomicaceae bacterium]
MKNLAPILAILFLFNSHSFYAQVTIEGTYLPVVNTRIQQVWDTSATLMPVPTTGPNQLWDYSMAFDPSLTLVNLDTFDLAVKTPSTTPYFSDFPDATHASFLRSPFGLADSLWLYFIVDTLGVHNMGYYSTSADAQGLITADPMEFVMPDELNYLDTIYDTSRYEGYINYMGFDAKIVRVNLKTMIADGYGTLITPDATYGDVMLGKEVIYEIDSLWVDLTGGGIYSLIQADTTDWHRFHFLRNNTFASTHLMQINTNMAETDVKYGWYTLPVDFGSINGTVYDTTGVPVTNGEMYLYREHSNHTKNDILSMTTINFDGTYTFDSIPYGEYRISARPDLGIYNHAFTTYYGDTTDWINCQTVITSNDTTGIDIHIVIGAPQSTSVSIQGNVS